MRRAFLCLFGVILAIPLYGQTGTGAGKPSPVQMTAPRKNLAIRTGAPTGTGSRYKPGIPVNTPIVTLDGVCTQPAKGTAKSATACKTIVTRGQLDALLDSVEPDASPKSRQQFAITYARLLAAAQIAEQNHLDLLPDVNREIQVRQKLARMEVLSYALIQSLQKNARHIPPKDVEAYYKQYPDTFEQAEVRRLAVPLNATTEDGKPLDVSTVKAKLEELRPRALDGDNFSELQTQAYKELGIKGPLPQTEMGMMRKSSLSPEEAKVFKMESGETSPVFEDQGIVMILHAGTARAMKLEDARPQIEAMLFQQRMLEEFKDSTKGINAEFNLQYMESKSQPELFPPSVVYQGGMSRRGMLSSLHVQP